MYSLEQFIDLRRRDSDLELFAIPLALHQIRVLTAVVKGKGSVEIHEF
jgi:hypothetical protein